MPFAAACMPCACPARLLHSGVHGRHARLLQVLPELAKEIEAQDPRRARSLFLATTLLRGDQPDTGGGYAVLAYNPLNEHLSYTLEHRTIPEGSANFVIPELLNLTYSARSVQGLVLRKDVASEPVNTTSASATCQTASGAANPPFFFCQCGISC